jgi:hypothetical protein
MMDCTRTLAGRSLIAAPNVPGCTKIPLAVAGAAIRRLPPEQRLRFTRMRE